MTYVIQANEQPDLRDLFVAMANEPSKPEWNVGADDVLVRRQRTFADCVDDRDGALRRESAVLATIRANRKVNERLAILWAVEVAGVWRVGAYSHGAVGKPQGMPFAAAGIIQGKRLILGISRSVPELATLKATFADGTTLEESLDGGFGLLFQPLTTPAAWAAPAVVQILDSRGSEFTSERFDVREDSVRLATRPGGRDPRPYR